MSLEELNEKLHGRDVHLDRTRQHTVYEPGAGEASPDLEARFRETEEWRDPIAAGSGLEPGLVFSDISTRRRRRRIAWGVGIMAALILIGGLTIKARSLLFSEDQVTLSITGPRDVASAEETTFTVTYGNQNWAALENAVLVIAYPETFRPDPGQGIAEKGSFAEIVLGTIKDGDQGKKEIRGKFYGSKGDVVYLKAVLRYTPKGVATVFEKETRFGVNVASSPLSLEITAPLELASGQDVEFVIDYSNRSDLGFSNLRVKAEYPEGFQFVTSDPRPSEGIAVWYVGNLNARAEGKIVIRGVLVGSRDEHKRIRGMIGFLQGDEKFVAYAENERQMRIIGSPLALSQTVNGLTDVTVVPGEVLRYVIRYKNESGIGLRDAILTLELNSTLLDMSRLVLPRGAYDAARKILVWKASDIPGLGKIEPGASGEVTFSVPVVAVLPAESEKNLSIRSLAKIDSPDIPTSLGANKIIGSNMLIVKLNSLVSVGAKALYTDATFPNTGPFPPKVGQETSYTLRLNVASSSNDLKQARVSIILPTGVRYSGKFAPQNEVTAYNERTNELIWELGVLAPTAGKPRELVFQVAAVPSPSDVEKLIFLMQKATFTAKDAFTGQDVRVEIGEVTSFLRDDPTYGSMGGQVQKAE